jgi:hypothetical protein
MEAKLNAPSFNWKRSLMTMGGGALFVVAELTL